MRIHISSPVCPRCEYLKNLCLAFTQEYLKRCLEVEPRFFRESMLIFCVNTDEQKIEYLTRLFEETYIKDIMERHHIEKVREMNVLINILASGVGSLTNAFKFGTPLKYYFEDVGLRNARLGFRQAEETHLMENIIYNELRVRGRRVDLGVVIKRNRTEEGEAA